LLSGTTLSSCCYLSLEHPRPELEPLLLDWGISWWFLTMNLLLVNDVQPLSICVLSSVYTLLGKTVFLQVLFSCSIWDAWFFLIVKFFKTINFSFWSGFKFIEKLSRTYREFQYNYPHLLTASPLLTSCTTVPHLLKFPWHIINTKVHNLP
jgi:hypothetical protein